MHSVKVRSNWYIFTTALLDTAWNSSQYKLLYILCLSRQFSKNLTFDFVRGIVTEHLISPSCQIIFFASLTSLSTEAQLYFRKRSTMLSSQYIIQVYKSPQRGASVSLTAHAGGGKWSCNTQRNTYKLTWMVASTLISLRSSSLACADVLDSRGRPLMLRLSTWSICMAGCSTLFSSCLATLSTWLSQGWSPNWVFRPQR